VTNLLDVLRSHAAPGQITGIIEQPERPGRTTCWPEWIPTAVRHALTRQGVERPWIHQAEAAESIHAGLHTVIATGTGSGKSLAAWVPFLAELVRFERNEVSLSRLRRRPTALYLSPTKALAADQLDALSTLCRIVDPQIGVSTVDGDSELPQRSWARDYADIILTNPDFAHHALLARQQNWTRLWRGLYLIVVDEFHTYRGLFGAHVALTLRRLLRMAAHYGARPVVVFLSATSDDPESAAERMLGEALGPVVGITDDGAPRGAQTTVLWQCRELDDAHNSRDGTGMGQGRAATGPPPRPRESRQPRLSRAPLVTGPNGQEDTATSGHGEMGVPTDQEQYDPDIEFAGEERPRRAANTEAGELTGALVAAGARCLTFVRSRAGTERVAEIARDYLANHAPQIRDKVAAYRGGYLPEERRELEGSLRDGTLSSLVSTNALELGIDISGLDAVVVTGWPGTHASFAQQTGRAGRAGQAGLSVFIGRDNPLDQFLLSHPDSFRQPPAAANVFDPANPNVLVPQLCAAAAELPLVAQDAALFGLADTTLFDDLAAGDLLRKRPTGWYWNTTLGTQAHDTVSLRGEASTVSIINSEDGALLGTVGRERADTTVYPGAIYLHQGIPYQVDELDSDTAVVHPHREEEIRTYSREEHRVEILETTSSVNLSCGTWAVGQVVVSSRVTGYDIRRSHDGMYLGSVPLTMPLRQFETTGTWWTLSAATLKQERIPAADLPGALHAAEHAAIGLLPLFATCDRWDLGGLSTAVHPQTGEATVIVHDAVAGGSGFARRGFDSATRWIQATLSTLETCSCQTGCPRCVQSPKCGNNNEPLSKAGAIQLLRLLLPALQEAGPAE